MKVLLIEDNEPDQVIITSLLPSVLYDVRLAGTLGDGVRSASEYMPDVVLLDLTLPDSSGAQTFTLFVEQAGIELPVIVLTGLNDESLAISALHAGVEDYLIKDDLDRGMLHKAIRHSVARMEYRKKIGVLSDSQRAVMKSLALAVQQQWSQFMGDQASLSDRIKTIDLMTGGFRQKLADEDLLDILGVIQREIKVLGRENVRLIEKASQVLKSLHDLLHPHPGK